MSASGRTCELWSDALNTGCDDLLGNCSLAKNYCRNPTSDIALYCYVRKPSGMTKEFCYLPPCDGERNNMILAMCIIYNLKLSSKRYS